MRTKRFQNWVTAGPITLPVSIVLSALFWLLTELALPEIKSQAVDYSLWPLIGGMELPAWVKTLSGFLLYGIIGYLLIELNNTFAIIRMRASVQTAIYFLLIAVCPGIHALSPSNLASAAFLIALFFLFKSYHQSRPESNLFHSFAFLGIGSLLFPPTLLFAPLFWVGAYLFRALHLRSVCASLAGLTLPYSLLLGYGFCSGRVERLFAPFAMGSFISPITWEFSPWLLATLAYMFVLFVASAGRIVTVGYEDKIRTRSYLYFLILTCLSIFLFAGLQPATGAMLLPFLLIGISILAGHLFALTNTRGANAFFCCMCAALIFLFGYNLWTLL